MRRLCIAAAMVLAGASLAACSANQRAITRGVISDVEENTKANNDLALETYLKAGGLFPYGAVRRLSPEKQRALDVLIGIENKPTITLQDLERGVEALNALREITRPPSP